MPTRSAEAGWQGDLMTGTGHLKLGSGVFEGAYDWKSRSADGPLTNPEELLGAAHAGCFTMAFSHQLAQAGHVATRIHTTANVHLEKQEEGFAITRIDLVNNSDVPGISPELFQELAEKAKAGCPLSKALAATEITLHAKLD
ncbi:MAG: OsmC family protein [Chthonomonadales bacterium]